MIRINLLGVPKSKKAKRQSISIGAARQHHGSSDLLVARLVLAETISTTIKLNSETQQLRETTWMLLSARTGRLAGVKAKYQEREKQFELYDRRVKVIHQLQAAQNGPSELLNTDRDHGEQHRCGLAGIDDRGCQQHQPGGYGDQCECGGEPDHELEEGELLQVGGDQGNVPGRKREGYAGFHSSQLICEKPKS